MNGKLTIASLLAVSTGLVLLMNIMAGTVLSDDREPDDSEHAALPSATVTSDAGLTQTAPFTVTATQTPTIEPTAARRHGDSGDGDAKPSARATPTPSRTATASDSVRPRPSGDAPPLLPFATAPPTRNLPERTRRTDNEAASQPTPEGAATPTLGQDSERAGQAPHADRQAEFRPRPEEMTTPTDGDVGRPQQEMPSARATPSRSAQEDREPITTETVTPTATVSETWVITSTVTATPTAGMGLAFSSPSDVIGTEHDLGSAGKPSCNQCHVTHGAKGDFLWSRPSNGGQGSGIAALCASCHDGSVAGLTIDNRLPGHTAGADCTACHDPHSRRTGFLR